MKNLIFTIILLQLTLLGSCQQKKNGGVSTNQTVINKSLSVNEYDQLLTKNPDAQLVDVRTANEYAGGHLANSKNIDFRSATFESEISKLDKNKPVFIYCLSGGRSSSAASQMKEMGFKEVYNMDGGIMKWNAANKPLDDNGNSNKQAKGMSKAKFEKHVKSDNYVLVDFNATWCAPCKKMMPILESIAEKRKNKMHLLKIDADINQDLIREKNIASIPYLELYKNGELIWQHTGYIEEKDLLAETKL